MKCKMCNTDKSTELGGCFPKEITLFAWRKALSTCHWVRALYTFLLLGPAAGRQLERTGHNDSAHRLSAAPYATPWAILHFM
jgi:hypothetical protein